MILEADWLTNKLVEHSKWESMKYARTHMKVGSWGYKGVYHKSKVSTLGVFVNGGIAEGIGMFIREW